ncbi:uncharacterized protein [Narcine bancroftii]|uniref:uncharacterized protein isoform X2 n=1 Tax=Narcine bancroftii TaxID=1343680 RepID=UPI003831F5ED
MERYEAAMVLGALGNAMGYYNVCHQCNKAGVKLNESDLSAKIDTMILKSFQWRAPFDTLMHMATAEALTSEPKFGAAARTMCIGMCYSKAEQLNDLLQASIECGQMTHSYPAGFLGTFCTALFTSFAIQGKPVAQWGWRMMELMPAAEQYCERKMKQFSDYRENWFSFEAKWQFYLQKRGIEKDGSDKAIFPKTYNIEEQNKLFRRWRLESSGKDKGLETTLITYDALLFAGCDWKKLCYSAMFHQGESDATGAIAGSLHGILFGFDYVPRNLYQNLEFRGHLELLGRQLYGIATADGSLHFRTDDNQRHEIIDVRQIARMFVNKRTSDKINNLINYIAHLEKEKKASTEKSVWLTNMFATTQVSIKAKTSNTEGKPRPTKFQLLQSRFTKIGFQNKLEKLERPESKTKRVSEQSNTAADCPSGTDKRDTDLIVAQQKCDAAGSQKIEGSLGKTVPENDVTESFQRHVSNPQLSKIDDGYANFTTMHKTIDLVVQQKCEPPVLKNEDTTLKHTCTESGITDPCSNFQQSTGKQSFLPEEANDTYTKTSTEIDVHMQLDSPDENKVTLTESTLQTATDILCPNTDIQGDYQTKNTLTASISGDVDENSGQNKSLVESTDQKLPSQGIVTKSSSNISETNPSDTLNVQDVQTTEYNENPTKPSGRGTNELDLPHRLTNDGQISLLQVTEDILSITNNSEENPPQIVKERAEETIKSFPSCPDLSPDIPETQTQKKMLQKPEPSFTTEMITYVEQNFCKRYKCLLSQPNELVTEDHSGMTKEHSPQTFTKIVEKTQTRNIKPFTNLGKNRSVKETALNSEPAASKIQIFPHNELLGMKDDTPEKYTRELVNTALHHTDGLQEQCLKIQNINREDAANSQIKNLQLFTNWHEKQKLSRIQQNSDSGSSTKIQILLGMELIEKEQEDNQYCSILCQSRDSVNTTVPLTVVQEQHLPEAVFEMEEEAILQTRNPESFSGLYKNQKLKEIPQRLQPVVTTKIKGDHQGRDICNHPNETVNVVKHTGDVQESFPAVDVNTRNVASALNECTGSTAFCERKPWKYKAFSYAEPSVISKSNRRVLMRATDVIQFSSPQSFDSA